MKYRIVYRPKYPATCYQVDYWQHYETIPGRWYYDKGFATEEEARAYLALAMKPEIVIAEFTDEPAESRAPVPAASSPVPA